LGAPEKYADWDVADSVGCCVQPSRCLFAVNLSYDTTEEDLAKFAECYAPVDFIKVVRDHESGRSKGFGFIYMQSTEAAMQVSGVR